MLPLKGKFLILTLLLLLLLGFYHAKTNYFLERQILKGIKQQAPQKPPFDKTIVLVGDSMTEYLGNLEELGYFLHRYYPNKKFLLLNYGYSSTNILSLPDRIGRDTYHLNRTFQAINDIPFDLILIESFGNNPLVDYPLKEGLKKQNDVLEKSVELLEQKHPKSSIVFIGTIAPSKEKYGIGAVNLTSEERKRWALERGAYIQNHIAFAKSHSIPFIDIYSISLNFWGDGDLKYLNPRDYIHPSPVGIYFIDDKIAEFIYKNRLLP